jgi:hypothetical protein
MMLVTFASLSEARASVLPFIAECKTAEIHSFYQNARNKGRWGADQELYHKKWRFVFDGQRTLTVNDDEVKVKGAARNVVTAYDFKQTRMAQTMTNYMINYDLKRTLITITHTTKKCVW